MFKEILIPLVLGEIREEAIRLARAIASFDQGRVIGLVGASLAVPIAATWTYYPAGMYESMDEAAKATVHKLAEAAEHRLSRESVSHEVRVSTRFWLTSTEMSALHARYADLTVVGMARPLQEAERRLVGGVLAGSGRPLLVVPAGALTLERLDHILIAWKSSREASRAMHDAMPLLQRARSVSLMGHLERHGVSATVFRRSGKHADAGEAILEHARESGPDLIVAGGYSHPRALEQVFGGVTRHLLEHSSIPVLFSH